MKTFGMSSLNAARFVFVEVMLTTILVVLIRFFLQDVTVSAAFDKAMWSVVARMLTLQLPFEFVLCMLVALGFQKISWAFLYCQILALVISRLLFSADVRFVLSTDFTVTLQDGRVGVGIILLVSGSLSMLLLRVASNPLKKTIHD